MAQLGLPVPPANPNVFGTGTPLSSNVGGVLPMSNLAATLAAETPPTVQPESDGNDQPVIQGLAGRIRGFFNRAAAARQTIDVEMLEALLARRGEYTSAKKAQIKESGQPEIYMMVASGKMRQIESLLRDAIMGTGTEKPWTLEPTPDPELPPEIVQEMVNQLTMEIQTAMMSGFMPTVEAAQQRLKEMRSELDPMLMEKAREMAERMENKMEDQLLEGGYLNALDQFITDLATYKAAFIAGPVVRRKPKLTWGQGGLMTVEVKESLEWERVDPFDVFPAPWAKNISDGPLVRRHRLTRDSLTSMIGVEGFNEMAIRECIKLYGSTGHREAQGNDQRRDIAEGKMVQANGTTELIDALQYWGSASGQMLVDWGMDAKLVPDLEKEYQIEAWMVHNTVIKAVLNADPLARRPLYSTCFQKVPGSVWGNAPYDLLKDCQDMCNAAARSLAANMGISSGPQVYVLSDRVATDDDITEMYPWKIWQFNADNMGSAAKPIEFFQPTSNANELMAVYERFSLLADEYTGIPRYMAGFNGGEGGAGRTASGISMMISNASKIIKQVIGAIDADILSPKLERLYYYNMRYGTDPDLKGDVNIVARGASSLVAKEAARVRNNEFLQVVLNSPAAQQIMGIEGVAEILRGTVKQLDHNPDKVVPPLPVLRMRMAQQMQQQMLMAQQAGQQGQPGEPGQGGDQLNDGSPAADHYSPKKGPPRGN